MEKIVNLCNVPLIERPHARQGRFHAYRLLNGVEDAPENFYLQLSKTYTDFSSPRHRHNFDQIRFQIEGAVDYDRDGVMEAGSLGYFPEGVHYGPQRVADESLALVLQFGGASGNGYISEDAFQAAVAEMKTMGEFENGIYRSVRPDGTMRSKDAYEAVWEHRNECTLKYPKKRYAKPILMDPDAFDWQSLPDSPGVQCKHLGTFSEREVHLSMLRIEPGNEAEFPERSILFVMKGAGTADGGRWEAHSVLYTGARPGRAAATAEAQLLEIRLPKINSPSTSAVRTLMEAV